MMSRAMRHCYDVRPRRSDLDGGRRYLPTISMWLRSDGHRLRLHSKVVLVKLEIAYKESPTSSRLPPVVCLTSI